MKNKFSSYSTPKLFLRADIDKCFWRRIEIIKGNNKNELVLGAYNNQIAYYYCGKFSFSTMNIIIIIFLFKFCAYYYNLKASRRWKCQLYQEKKPPRK